MTLKKLKWPGSQIMVQYFPTSIDSCSCNLLVSVMHCNMPVNRIPLPQMSLRCTLLILQTGDPYTVASCLTIRVMLILLNTYTDIQASIALLPMRRDCPVIGSSVLFPWMQRGVPVLAGACIQGNGGCAVAVANTMLLIRIGWSREMIIAIVGRLCSNCFRILGNHGPIARWHCDMVGRCSFAVIARVTVKHLKKSFVRFGIEVMKLIPTS